jgi:CubicO group peptidase (beta-lactamase class C family)
LLPMSFQHARRFLLTCVLLFGALTAVAQTSWPTKQWSASTPEAEGMDPAVLADLYDYLATPSFNTDSVIVVRHGRIVSEAYAAPFHSGLRHDLRSVTKSVVATLVAAAIQEGKISDEQKVLAFFPEHRANGPEQDALRVRHLLDMTSGIQWRERPYDEQSDARLLWASPDWAGFILAREVLVAPGTKFHYIAAAPHLLSIILTHSTGSNAAEYARRHLFSALGIDDFSWAADPKGHSVGESALRLKPRDMAKLGLLHLRQGRWEDRQLLPVGWPDALFSTAGVTHGAVPNAPPTYRNLWWTDVSVPYAAAQGRHGQHIVLLPKQDIVVVVTSKTADTVRGALTSHMVQRYLLPAVKSDAALPQDAAGSTRLAQAMQRFANPVGFESQTPSPDAKALSRRTFVLESNAWNYRTFALELDASEPHYRLVQADKTALMGEVTRGGAVGLEGRYVVSTRPNDRLWARRGRWLDENTFRIETQHLESSIVAEWTARFEGGQLVLTYTNGDGEALTMRGRPKD